MPAKRGRRVLWVAAAVLILALLGLLAFLGLDLPSRLILVPITNTPSVPPSPSPTTLVPTPLSESSPTPAGLSAEVLAEMDEIELQVSMLRGLDATRPVERVLISPEELRQHLLDDLLKDYSQSEAVDDARLLTLLGAIEPGFDLWGLYLALYAEQVAGYYDDSAGKMYIVDGSELGGVQRLTFAHEYDHALQDQNYDIDEGLGYTSEACDADVERCVAVLSLLEGDATLLGTQWLRTYATDEDLQQLQEYYQSLNTPVFNTAPQFIRRDFLFPYLHGLNFATDLYIEGNWAGVDLAYADLPVSTEQILHPEHYPEETPLQLAAPPDLASTLGEGWHEIDRGTLGEWRTRLTLEIYLADAAQAAEGWGADYYLAFFNDATNRGALVLVARWDRFVDAQEFFAAFQSYGQARFGQGTYTAYRLSWSTAESQVLFERQADQTLWILAPSAEQLQSIREVVPFPAPLR